MADESKRRKARKKNDSSPEAGREEFLSDFYPDSDSRHAAALAALLWTAARPRDHMLCEGEWERCLWPQLVAGVLLAVRCCPASARRFEKKRSTRQLPFPTDWLTTAADVNKSIRGVLILSIPSELPHCRGVFDTTVTDMLCLHINSRATTGPFCAIFIASDASQRGLSGTHIRSWNDEVCARE